MLLLFKFDRTILNCSFMYKEAYESHPKFPRTVVNLSSEYEEAEFKIDGYFICCMLV